MASMLNPKTPTIRTQLDGQYQRKQCGKIYTYSGAYGVNSEGTWWLVTVRCAGRLKGTPMGSLPDAKSPTKSDICAFVERQIEELDQVQE